MKKSIVLYPQLTKQHLKELAPFIQSLEISYTDSCEENELNVEIEDTGNPTVYVKDNLGKWSIDKYGLRCKGEIRIKNSGLLFKKGGLVPTDAILGIGLQWKSKSSNARGSSRLKTINSSDSDVSISFDMSFKQACLRNNVELSFVLYLYKNGKAGLSVEPGTLMGELIRIQIILEGEGSLFTVFEKNVQGEPLWEIDYEWEDPEFSQFSECVRVTVNKGHPAWQTANDDEMRKELLKEIMASSMQIIISELESDQYDPSEEYEPGSVSSAISYFVSRASINTESSASIAKSIRCYLDKAMK